MQQPTEKPEESGVPAEIKASSFDRRFFAHFTVKKSHGGDELVLDGSRVSLRRGRRLGDDDIADLLLFLRENRRVVELDLSCNEIRCDGFIDMMNYMATREEIVKLDLRNNEIRSRGIKHLCESCGDKLRLKTLRLNGNKFGVQASKQVALMLLNNPYLRELNVAQVDQTASSLVYFIGVLRYDQPHPYNDTLKILNLSGPNPESMYRLDSAHLAHLLGAMLKSNKCLEELHLGKFRFACHDIEVMLAEGKSNVTLLSLDLTANNIGDLGAQVLADWLAGRPALASLGMARNIITSTGATAFSRGLPFSRIKHFDISHNRIQDCGVREILSTIKKSPCVRNLGICGNCIGHDSSKMIHRMLLSGVLHQENIDVRPYKIGQEWKCARYSVQDCKQHR